MGVFEVIPFIDRCAEFERKRGLIYTEHDSENCRVIQPSCSGTETFMPQDGTQIFKG